MTKKLTDKQKSRLWQQQRSRSFLASSRLDVLEPHAQDEVIAQRVDTIELGPLHRGLPWLCAIHQQLFQDVFDWAGDLRDVDISKGETRFCHFEYIENEGNDLLQEMEDEHYLTGLARNEFVNRLAHYYCEINVLHPFFVGSGRAQRVFFEQLAIHAGYLLDWSEVDPDEWQAANQAGALGDLTQLSEIFTKVVSEARESE
ncbi:putative adenosine monophosphate-protein transferase Fic [Buttiauxella sp. WJP83]|uniref:putative adenosine monophosphate-protein transferase Fic n=1 Tax=Buttiauxella sp. WJP83 TaxID=2986951 RepID=UPI0022DD59BE|nr:putative adenosine monophosphate-protein transferase Fic [Buttiauxella sp. WJP83]WBM70991.1 putative adenosine monophosphate-protein transferase Fic [Buttiauxella sp. WJP83]